MVGVSFLNTHKLFFEGVRIAVSFFCLARTRCSCYARAYVLHQDTASATTVAKHLLILHPHVIASVTIEIRMHKRLSLIHNYLGHSMKMCKVYN